MQPELLRAIVTERLSGPGSSDLPTLVGRLRAEVQERVRPQLARLTAMTVGETTEVRIAAEVWLPGTSSVVAATAVALRAGGSVLLVERRIR